MQMRLTTDGSGTHTRELGLKVIHYKQIPTTGTVLVLDMGRSIQLPQEFDAPGNIGQFSLQVIVDAVSYTHLTLPTKA